jgi:hypothetical protein
MYSSCYCYGPSYCPGHLTKEKLEAVGFRYGDVGLMLCRYDVRSLPDGWNQEDDGEYYFIRSPH